MFSGATNHMPSSHYRAATNRLQGSNLSSVLLGVTDEEDGIIHELGDLADEVNWYHPTIGELFLL